MTTVAMQLQNVEAAVLAMHREPSRAAECDRFLQQFSRSEEAWSGALQLLGSVHPECRLASGAMLHLKARRDASSLASVDALALLSRCLEALSGTARTLRAQLTVAAAHLASRALAGPEGLPALPAFAALPPAQRVELLGSLPLAWPPERLRTSLPAVLALLTSLVDTEATGS